MRFAHRLPDLEHQALTDLDRWFALHPDAYVAVSGGKDSITCLHLARTVNPQVRAVFFNSGLEFPQTPLYLHHLQQVWGFELVSIDADPSALEVMARSGYWEHGAAKYDTDSLQDACITRPLAQARKRFGKFSVYGLRADEAATRKAMLSRCRGWVTKHDHQGRLEQAYLAPIWRWGHHEVHAYLGQHDIPVNPIYDALTRLGVPERRQRVGLLVDGWALQQGRWVLARQIAPDFCRLVETHLPMLADFR